MLFVVVVVVVVAPTVVAVAEGSLGLSTVDILTDRLIVSERSPSSVLILHYRLHRSLIVNLSHFYVH